MDIHIYHHFVNQPDNEYEKLLSKVLGIVTQTQKTITHMAQEIDDLKAINLAQSDALDALTTTVSGLSTSLDGITADEQFLKDKIQQLIDAGTGADTAALQELVALATANTDKITALSAALSAASTKASDLDAATDSTTPTP